MNNAGAQIRETAERIYFYSKEHTTGKQLENRIKFCNLLMDVAQAVEIINLNDSGDSSYKTEGHLEDAAIAGCFLKESHNLLARSKAMAE